VNRPVSAADRSASRPAVRIRPIARSANTCPRRPRRSGPRSSAWGLAGQVRHHRAELDPPPIPAPWRATGFSGVRPARPWPVMPRPQIGRCRISWAGDWRWGVRARAKVRVKRESMRTGSPGRVGGGETPNQHLSSRLNPSASSGKTMAPPRGGTWGRGLSALALPAPARCWRNARIPGAVAAGPGQCGLASRDVGPDAAVLVAGP
jgi:hypothetical protein